MAARWTWVIHPARKAWDSRRMKLLRRAAVIAGTYVALATAWILGTGALASALARSAEELERIERFKGLFFVGGTGLILLAASWLVLRRLEADLSREADARETLLRLERHSLAGLFVSSIAHDANNVATVLYATFDELEALKVNPAAAAAIQMGEGALKQLQQLFADLKQMGRFDASHRRESKDLVELARHTAKLLRGHTLLKHCQLEVQAPGPVTLALDATLVEQLLINLLINAADATQGRGRIEIRVRQEASEAVLEVHDDGPGVPKESQAQLFRAFQTTKPHGTGLGLVSVRECATRHGGQVAYASSPLGGACFTVRFPLQPEASAPRP